MTVDRWIVGPGAGGSPIRLAALACAGLVVACGGEDTGSSEAERSPPATPVAEFPAAPADGPMPEIGPAPDTYRPTAAGAPSTDIWIGRLVWGREGLSVDGLVRATERAGYDNQPAFVSYETFYYVSAVDSTQTDVMRYTERGDPRERVTRTPGASEFSPTPIPGQDAFSAIREVRGRQYLWRYATDGTEMGPIFATAEPVGYHAWADETVVGMFILGEPATLQLGNAVTGEIRVVAENPGRSIHRIPGTTDLSFVRKVSEDEWWIERLDPASGVSERLTRTLPGREDYAWTDRGWILMGDGSVLHLWTEEDGWMELQDLAPMGVTGITRIAVGPEGQRIAIVGDGS